MEIRSDCPTNCKYICGDKCIATECYNKGSFIGIAKRLNGMPPLDAITIPMEAECIVCGESTGVHIKDWQFTVGLCDKCRNAILKLRDFIGE